VRWTTRTEEQASLFTATNRIEGRVTASQMAAASAASVFPRFTQLLAFFEKLPRCLIGMEACGGAHDWARKLQELGHDVRPRTRPFSSTPWIWKTLFARSIPTVASSDMGGSSGEGLRDGVPQVWDRAGRCGSEQALQLGEDLLD
jgi:hypothetical protein